MPDSVAFEAEAGRPIPARLMVIRMADDESLVIERVEADDAALVCDWSKGPNKPATVKVRVDRSKLSVNELKSALHIHVSKPVQETLTVPVTVRVR
jgi:hypothetical protein